MSAQDVEIIKDLVDYVAKSVFWLVLIILVVHHALALFRKT